jgi:hypothetical protein
MTARRVATAQREGPTVAPQLATEEFATEQLAAEQLEVTWGELGCPKEIGLYRAGDDSQGLEVRVKRIHILVAEDDPSALFTVVEFRPPLGPAEFVLGHRVA